MGHGMHQRGLARSVVQEKRAAAHGDEYNSKYAWFAESYRALEWLLARSCDSLVNAFEIEGSAGKYTYAQDAVGDCLPIWVVYQCSEYRVTIYDLKVREL